MGIKLNLPLKQRDRALIHVGGESMKYPYSTTIILKSLKVKREEKLKELLGK